MPPQLALLLATAFVVYVFRWDRKHGYKPSWDLFWPLLWYLVCASRPIGYWLNLWGVPLPTSSGDPTEGSVIDRYFFATLAVIGIVILVRRGFAWGTLFSANAWAGALFAYMALSILWSDYSFVSFKRYIKVIGSVVMALVVLTDEKPLDAAFTVLRRCLYIHLPMSVLCTRYFREIGVAYTYSGEGQWWQGISTSKNTLGQISMLGVLYFFWETRRHWPTLRWRNLHLLYLALALYLMKGAGDTVSMTSVSVAVFAVFIFLRLQALHHDTAKLLKFVKLVFWATVALITLVVTHSVVMFSSDSFFGSIITTFGRDVTLTDRTNIWADLYAEASRNPIFGVGFGGFWIGRMANIPWAANLTWVLGQGHSGYVDTYLQLGLVGSVLLVGVLISTLPRLLATIPTDFDFACFRITMLMTIMYVNITESTYLRGDHQFWFILMLVIWVLPSPTAAGQPQEESFSPAEIRRPGEPVPG
jgi:exopolysaccharide production protein ExoQ